MRLINSFLFVLWFLLMTTPGLAQENTPDPAEAQASVFQKMHDFFAALSDLRPYMVSGEKFKAPENAQHIESELVFLNNTIKDAAHEPRLATPTYRISRQVLQNHVAETLQLFRSGNKDRARWSLNSTLSLCMACHSQVPSPSTTGFILDENGVFAKSFERAEWLFVARDFDKALTIYSNTLRSYPANKATPSELQAALERKIAIYARVKRNLSEAKTSLQGDLRNKDLPVKIQEIIRSWISSIDQLSSEKWPDPSKATASQITTFAKNYLEIKGRPIREENSRAATYMLVSGILYEYLNTHPKTDLAPQILRWLAQCDREIDSRFFFPLVDVYLRQCIVQYPKSSVAPECYQDYEKYARSAYSGNIPETVKEELQELKEDLK